MMIAGIIIGSSRIAKEMPTASASMLVATARRRITNGLVKSCGIPSVSSLRPSLIMPAPMSNRRINAAK